MGYWIENIRCRVQRVQRVQWIQGLGFGVGVLGFGFRD
jgi:hypothetical protein